MQLRVDHHTTVKGKSLEAYTVFRKVTEDVVIYFVLVHTHVEQVTDSTHCIPCIIAVLKITCISDYAHVNGSDKITLTDKGSYWLHAFEDLFSIDYISKLWGTSKQEPWPEKVNL